MKIVKEVENLLNRTVALAQQRNHEYVTPEHLLYCLTEELVFASGFTRCGGDLSKLRSDLEDYLGSSLDELSGHGQTLLLSDDLNQVFLQAELQARASDRDAVEIPHLIRAIFNLTDSYAAYYMLSQGVEPAALLFEMNMDSEEEEDDNTALGEEEEEADGLTEASSACLKYAQCLNDEVKAAYATPLVGREAELERTMQVLCRRAKNNPLHIGEPGVGKTALVYGLADRINRGQVPERLQNARIYSLDLGSLIAGTQYRGDFEKRLKQFLEAVSKEDNAIIYIDEIHNIVGAGAVGGGSLDASNLLKPYLADGRLRFIGATTYEDYKKYFSKSKSLLRRFQNIDIQEPSCEEAIDILNGLKKYYEEYHHVRYNKGTMEHAVMLSSKYINERYLPDKAIDLIDEAGAYREMHPKDQKIQTVDKKLIEEVLSKICSIPRQTVETDELKSLAKLYDSICKQVFGQNEAADQLSNAIKFSRAGLTEDNKPLASLLFVGPTGVGKTEMAKTLAQVMGISLIRFDMSEYAEKHTVAKLIGSPAGYVGYEEGGLLTEAIRKTPNCVLLLDEIEKAHGDIYNILLQVMDYATLTDNQGRKADFRNVILIMTSNAGASMVGKNLAGFGSRELTETAIADEVKRIFSPEFRNRLDRIITFHPIDEQMALQIVDKLLAQLSGKLSDKQVELHTTESCRRYLMQKGVTREYGAREISRVINTEVKPLLVDQILFGKLKKGGKCLLDIKDGKITAC